MNKKNLSTVFSYILALFLAITIFAGCMCDFAYKTVCDPEMLVTVADSCGYTSGLHEEIVYKWENLVSVTGIPDTDPFVQIVTQERVEESALSYLRNAYTGTAEIETQAIADELRNMVHEYAYGNNTYETPEAELDRNIENLVSACVNEYTNSIRVPMLPKLLSALSKLAPVLKNGPIICVAFSSLLIVFLFFLQNKRADVLFYFAVSTLANAVLLLGTSWLAMRYRVAERLPIAISALRTLAVSYVNCLFEKLLTYGQAFLLAAAAALVLHIVALILVKVFKKKPAVCSDELCGNEDI